jgi:chromate transporter
LFPLTLLFKKFLKLGATAYGGPAMMAQMKKAIVKDLGWLKEVRVYAGDSPLLTRLGVSEKALPSQAPSGTRKRNAPYLLGLAVIISALFAVCYFLNEQLFYLALIMAKVGALAFGGGFTTIGLIQLDVVERFQWVSTKEFLDGIVMGQVTPGPIVITATFLGYKLAGFLGAAMATVAIFTSDFFILSLLIPYYDRLRGIKAVRIMEQGILAAFVGMLGLVLYNFGRTTFVDIPTVLFAVGAFVALLKKVDLLYILLTGAVLSILVFGLIL